MSPRRDDIVAGVVVGLRKWCDEHPERELGAYSDDPPMTLREWLSLIDSIADAVGSHIVGPR